jgi:hypothetical protein
MPTPTEPPDLPNYSTKDGAKRLLATIRNYWAYRGYDVSLEIVELDGAPRNFGIKSNLVNGLPRARRASPMRLAA